MSTIAFLSKCFHLYNSTPFDLKIVAAEKGVKHSSQTLGKCNFFFLKMEFHHLNCFRTHRRKKVQYIHKTLGKCVTNLVNYIKEATWYSVIWHII